jgi:excisionase family DNA binding protein
MTTIATEEVYTVGEVATIFRVPVDTIRRLIARGELPALRLGTLDARAKARGYKTSGTTGGVHCARGTGLWYVGRQR